MPKFIVQLDLFDPAGQRIRVADGVASADTIAVLPPQTAASCCIVISDLVQQLGDVLCVAESALEAADDIDEGEPCEWGRFRVLRDARQTYGLIRLNWPGLRFDHY